MLSEHRQQLAHFLGQALEPLLSAAAERPTLTEDDVLASLHTPKQADHGDQATGIVLRLAKPLASPPPKLAAALVAQLVSLPGYRSLIAEESVAGPGFINFRLAPAAKTAVVAQVIDQSHRFGTQPEASESTVLIEFVSANPTGPLHVGHGRQAALGDSLAAIMAARGHRVVREFYYNDAGAQIHNLARSVQARALGQGPDHPDFPADGYRGSYIEDIAQAFLAGETVQPRDGEPVLATRDVHNLEDIRRFAVAYLRVEQDLDLSAFGVQFDHFALESALYRDGRVEHVVGRLIENGHAYELDGALWLRSTDYGDDKDRVMRKSDGGYTYFVPDVAYHLNKWERGFHQAINIQGSDHHGTTARVRAGLQALDAGIPAGYPDYVLHKMVTVMRGGEEVKISKRAGSYVTLRDLIQWSGELRNEAGERTGVDEIRGRDAVRFFLVSRKAESEFVFDIDLALSRSDENPVYYIQYAHARVMQVFSQADLNFEKAQAWALALSAQDRDARLARLGTAREMALVSRLAEYPTCLATATEELAPHYLAFYLRDLAADLHGFYNSDRVLIDDLPLKEGRLLLLLATAQVLRNGLGLLGVSAPERM